MSTEVATPAPAPSPAKDTSRRRSLWRRIGFIASFGLVAMSVTRLVSGQDVLTEILRDGARRMLAQAVEAEVAAYVAAHDHLVDDRGRRQVVRNGHLPERTIQTGLGEIEVKQPRVHDRRPPTEREEFTPAVLPPYLGRTRSLEELIPWLYLKGISTGDFSEALQAILGPDAPNLSATTITRLKAVWEADHEAWSKRSLADKRYVYGASGLFVYSARQEEIVALSALTADRF